MGNLRRLLDPLDHAAVECDGMARLVCTVLAEHGIEHTAFVGELRLNERVVRPHYWIEVGEFLIDYRARMWLGEGGEVPHGVCLKSELSAQYQGESCDIAPMPPALFRFLSMNRDELIAQLEDGKPSRGPKNSGLS